MGRFKRHIKVSRHHWKTHKDDEIFMPSSSDDPLVDMIQDGCTEIRSCNVGIRDLSDDPKIDLTLTRRSKRFRKSGVDDQVELDNDRIILNRPGSVVKRSSRVKIDEIDLDPETKYTDDDLGAVVIIKEVLSKNQLMEVVHRPPILAPASKSSSSQGLINENIIVDLTEDSQILDNVPSIVIDTSSVVEVTGSVKMRKSETRCLVCLDDFSHPASVRCGHVFCEACIRMAVHSTKKCPACRKPVKKQDIRRLYM